MFQIEQHATFAYVILCKFHKKHQFNFFNKQIYTVNDMI